MGSNLTETFSVDEVFAWLNVNGFEEVGQAFYGMYCLFIYKHGPQSLTSSDNRKSQWTVCLVYIVYKDLFASCFQIFKNVNTLSA